MFAHSAWTASECVAHLLSSCTIEVSLWPRITICCSFNCLATCIESRNGASKFSVIYQGHGMQNCGKTGARHCSKWWRGWAFFNIVLDWFLHYSSEFKISSILTSDKLQSQALFYLSITQSFLDNSSPTEKRKIWILVGSHTHNSIHVLPSTLLPMRV